MNIPQGYKQTELGSLPADWDIQSVGKHCTVKARIGWQGLRSDEYLPSGEYGLITSTDIVDGAIDWKTCCFVSKTRYTQDPNIIVQEDDTLISKDGTIGKVGIVQNIPFPSTLNSGVFVIRPKLDNVYKRYLAFAFKSIYFQDFINRLTAGSTIVHLYQKDIVKFSFPVPPIAEQRAIAEALSDVDGLIAALDKKIAKKRLLKQGAIQQLLTGKKRLPGFTDEWVSVQLKEICSFQNGYTPSKTVRHFWENGTVPWFRMEDIRTNGRILNHAIQHVTNAAVKGDLFPAGSIIMSTTATIGEHALLIVDSLANQQFTNLIIRKSLDKQVDTMWFYHYCYILGEWCRNNINDGGLAAVNMDDFSNVHITLPPILEQQAIATILSDMDKEIADLEAQRDKYRLLKSGMMQKLLTGQIRFKNE